MNRLTVDPLEYLRIFCAELGDVATAETEVAAPSEVTVASHSARKMDKRRLFLRLYQYRGRPFVIRAYERILGRPPGPDEIAWAMRSFFEGEINRTSMMLALQFGEEGRLTRTCNVFGLSALRTIWNVTHSRRRRVAPPPRGG